MTKLDAETLRTYASYSFEQLIDLILELQAAEEAAYDQGYDDGFAEAQDQFTEDGPSS